MRRQGKKKSPYYRLVVIDSRAACDGRPIEVVGHYDPTAQPERLHVDRNRIEHWVGKGAQLSDTVRTLLARNLVEGETIDTPVSAEPVGQ